MNCDEPDELVLAIVRKYLERNMVSYKGHLASAVMTVQNGWLANVDSPEYAEHLNALRQHMASTGHFECDTFLLHLGLTIPGIQRRIVPPLIVLSKNRGGFSHRRLREAAGMVEHLQKALEIGRQIVKDLPADTEKAISKLLELVTGWFEHRDDEPIKTFLQLSDHQAEDLAWRAYAFAEGQQKLWRDIGIKILTHQASFQRAPLPEAVSLALLKRGLFWPASLYRESGEEVARQLAMLIEQDTDLSTLNHKLLALAWTRSATAQECFAKWKRHRPEWSTTLYVPPEDYLLSAGWCIDDRGEKRELISKKCFRMVPAEGHSTRTVRTMVPTDSACPSCDASLVWLFDFTDVDRDSEPIRPAGSPQKVLCCARCACYGPVFAKYRGDGATEFVANTTSYSEMDEGEFPAETRQFSLAPVSPFVGAEPFQLNELSTIGGVPMWVQDAEFPHCIKCSQTMQFLAQYDCTEIGGSYYAFYCNSCCVSAVGYQQT